MDTKPHTRIYAKSASLSTAALDISQMPATVCIMEQDSSEKIPPSLYGIVNSNRKPDEFWGKNQFNNVFPMSIACWMRQHDIPIVAIESHAGKIECREQDVNTLLGLAEDQDPFFDFEASFDSHTTLCHDKSERVDVVISGAGTKPRVQQRCLEIKLVVVPDSASANCSEDDWAPEIVFRPSTSTNCAMGIYKHLEAMNKLGYARKILDPLCTKIYSWGNPAEMAQRAPELIRALQKLTIMTESLQEPLVVCTIWKTEGIAPVLATNAFDIFAWSNTAFMQMICERALTNQRKGISRQLRSALRMVRILHDLTTSKKVSLEKIISDMSFDKQGDKDFSISGKQTINYMRHPRLLNPIIGRDTLDKLIVGGGIEKLSPERRLDATLYFTHKYMTQR